MQAYLTFDGRCGEAFDFYAKALGGKIVFSMTYGDMPEEGANMPAAYKNRIMHASLEARGHTIMGADMMPNMGSEGGVAPAFTGYSGFSLSVQANDVPEGDKLFKALGEGGQVTMPYAPTFWALGFGMLTDKFGVNWMVNCEKPMP